MRLLPGRGRLIKRCTIYNTRPRRGLMARVPGNPWFTFRTTPSPLDIFLCLKHSAGLIASLPHSPSFFLSYCMFSTLRLSSLSHTECALWWAYRTIYLYGCCFFGSNFFRHIIIRSDDTLPRKLASMNNANEFIIPMVKKISINSSHFHEWGKV